MRRDNFLTKLRQHRFSATSRGFLNDSVRLRIEVDIGILSRQPVGHPPLFVIEFNSYAISACRNASPWALAQFILQRFGAFCFRRKGQDIVVVRTEQQGKDFIYGNMVVGCIDDIAFGGSFIDSL